MNERKTTLRASARRATAWWVAVLSVGLLLSAGVATLAAQSNNRDLDTIVDEILENQGVDSIENVNPDRVAPDLLEELGEAVMAERNLTRGSADLEEANRWMGYRYLRSGGNLSWMGWGPGMMGPGMVGPGMMGPGMMGFGRGGTWNNGSWAGPDRGPWGPSSRMWTPGMMNGWGDYSRSAPWIPPWTWVLLALLLIVIVVLLIVLFTRRGESKSRGGAAMEILRNRYARGEISREEFDKIREVLE